MKAIVTPKYREIIPPITVSTKAPANRDELRLSVTQREDETEAHIDLRFFTVYGNGSETPHRAGIRLTMKEAGKLRDALVALDLL